MARAIFHKNQRVYVKPVGTWAVVERVIPQWVKGMDEPLKVHYDVGLGREFSSSELQAEEKQSRETRSVNSDDLLVENWRIKRAHNRWSMDEDTDEHPFPGTFPVVVTDENDWGGWRVPGKEYERDPERIEHQARVITNSLHMMKLLKKLVEHTSENPNDVSDPVKDIARGGIMVLRNIYEVPDELPVHKQAAE